MTTINMPGAVDSNSVARILLQRHPEYFRFKSDDSSRESDDQSRQERLNDLLDRARRPLRRVVVEPLKKLPADQQLRGQGECQVKKTLTLEVEFVVRVH
jgi:predicted naringenin-chalcone synthase